VQTNEGEKAGRPWTEQHLMTLRRHRHQDIKKTWRKSSEAAADDDVVVLVSVMQGSPL